MENLKIEISDKNDKLWVDKYRPQKIEDTFLKSDDINKINNWINDFIKKKKGYKNCLLVHGPPGTGKTTISNLILKSKNYDVIEFNASEVRNQKLISSKLKDILGKRNVMDMMLNNSKKIAIIMDEIDGMSSGDRGGLSELIKIMYQHRKGKKKNLSKEETPFICISNTVNEKKFNDIKKNSIVVKVAEPSLYNMMKLVEKIKKNENLDLDMLEIKNIIKEAQGDFRRLVNMFQYMFSHGNKINTDIKDIMQKKDKYFTPYECVDKLLNIYTSIDDNLRLYDIDKNIIGMLFYENFLNFIIKNRKGDSKTKINNIAKFYDNFSCSDILDNHIYINQKWELYDYNCVLKCSYNSYMLSKMGKYSCNKNTNLSFSSLLNKTSLEYLNYKNIKQISDKINLCDTSNNIVYACNIICNYIFKEKNHEKLIEILRFYNFEIDEIDKIIKLSLRDYKDLYNPKLKKELKNIAL